VPIRLGQFMPHHFNSPTKNIHSISACIWQQVGDEIRLELVLILILVLLPLAGAASEEGMTVVPAQEILDKIERGLPVKYDHVTIKGDLDLKKLDLPTRPANRTWYEIEVLGLSENATLVSSPIRINDSTIEGFVFLNNAIFGSSVDIRGSAFDGYANFGHSAFNGTANFGRSAFNGTANFGRSAFNGYANFGRSAFNGTAIFWDSAFNGTANFGRSAFNGDADFGNSAFNADADFGNSAFNGDAYFWGSAFNGDAYFWDSAFNGIADFRGSAFNGTANFGNSAFNGTANFGNSAFNGTANFGGSAFNGPDFSLVQFNKLVSFDDTRFCGSTSFNSSRFKEDALFEGADFNGTLYLTRAKYDRLYISWKNIKKLGYDDAAYLSLLENFKKLGYLEDYDACYYEYRRLHREQSWSGKYHAMHPAEEWLRKRIDVGLEAFYGYGKKPIWPLLWSAGTIVFFGLFWRFGGLKRDKGANQRGILERYGPHEPSWKPKRRDWHGELGALADVLIFSATVFLSGTRLFVDPPLMPQMRQRSESWAKAAFIMERVLGAFFSILFFLAISGTVVR
ncbi:MAG: pentapeptide repeat-containing protein, partial [Methanothrix sp.]|nr:pentapeptide repeat-containing protein [Methanothrix sp.]